MSDQANTNDDEKSLRQAGIAHACFTAAWKSLAYTQETPLSPAAILTAMAAARQTYFDELAKLNEAERRGLHVDIADVTASALAIVNEDPWRDISDFPPHSVAGRNVLNFALATRALECFHSMKYTLLDEFEFSAGHASQLADFLQANQDQPYYD